MILWVVLFLLIVAISFVLALQSMRDYQEVPQKPQENGLFLIRQVGNFSIDILGPLLKSAASQGLIISIERLFKGSKTTLVIFGPKTLLNQFGSGLDLLELEDYTASFNNQDVSAWELGVKNDQGFDSSNLANIFSNLPSFTDEDQFFWQVVIGKDQTQIRAAFYSKDLQKRQNLTPLFQDLKWGGLIKIPRPFSTEQMINFYKSRSLSKDSKAPVLSPDEVIRLVKI